MDKPPDSRITVELGMHAEDVVSLPPLGFNAPDAFRILVMLTWLAGFGALGAAVAREAFSPSRTTGERTLFFVWLVIWSLGFALVIWVSARLLLRMFGWQQLVFDYDKLIVRTALGMLRRRQVFRVDLIGSFSAAETSAEAGKLVAPAVTFEYAGKRMAIAHGRKARELEWLAAELNRLLERHRRR
jgi:hypothetical protein